MWIFLSIFTLKRIYICYFVNVFQGNKEIDIPTLTSINYHGSLLLQNLLKFGNPKPVVTSLLELRSVELKTMLCDPCGSHIVEAFMKSPTVGEKSREILYNKLKVSILMILVAELYAIEGNVWK